MSSGSVFDVIVVLCGLYMAFNGVLMKARGKINPGIVLSKNVLPEQIKDKKGFINYMWWKLVAIGILVAASGIFNITISSLMGLTDTTVIIELIVNFVFFVMLVIYGFIVVKAQKRFLGK